ncbi:MAG TPA: hypothetical protein PKD64_05290 [Pirellulaceae bacterium]|nr:hypothetical protein [Pirellulaceae bacterium]HMO91591.1 hypothetical protein [Pirellulaceae bacterium]HMP68288.1 hypothetical protein [Pirellulaceae bacterium]
MAQYQSHTHSDGPTLGGGGFGQNGLRLGPSARPFGQDNPITEENWYDYDAQMWSPFDVTGVDGHVHAPTGFFFAYDFLHLSIGRPEPQFGLPGVTGGNDFHWGRRYNLGYMGESDRGFSVSWLNTIGSFFPGNNAEHIDTVYYNIVEINRVFRQSVSSGGYIEPYLGARYTGISDRTFNDLDPARFRQQVDNSAFGAQIGSRYVRDFGSRWVFSFDGTLGGLYNTQRYSGINEVFNGVDFNVTGIRSNRGSDFVPFFDLEGGVQYRVTRDISLRLSGTIIYHWDGLVRANNLGILANPYSNLSGFAAPASAHVESNIAAGIAFGFDWRR